MLLYPPSQKKTGPFVEAPVRMAVWEAEELEGLEVELADCEKETGDEVKATIVLNVTGLKVGIKPKLVMLSRVCGRKSRDPAERPV